MNHCILVGRVLENPTLKETSNGNRLAQMLLAVARPYKNAQGEYDQDIFLINLWNGLADECLKNVVGDQLLALRCRLQANNYERDGETYYRVELVGEKIAVLTKND